MPVIESLELTTGFDRDRDVDAVVRAVAVPRLRDPRKNKAELITAILHPRVVTNQRFLH